jgi:hypothetical protein
MHVHDKVEIEPSPVATPPQGGITKCGAIATVKVSGVIADNINGT